MNQLEGHQTGKWLLVPFLLIVRNTGGPKTRVTGQGREAGEAEDVAVEGLVVEVAPGAAHAVAVVPGPDLWGAVATEVSRPGGWQLPPRDPPWVPGCSAEPRGRSAGPGNPPAGGASAGPGRPALLGQKCPHPVPSLLWTK